MLLIFQIKCQFIIKFFLFWFYLNKQNNIKNNKEILFEELYDFDEDSSFDNYKIKKKKTLIILHHQSLKTMKLMKIMNTALKSKIFL